MRATMTRARAGTPENSARVGPFDPAAAIEVNGLGKTFADVRALESIDLTIARGEFVSVIGPSGCGKSTLLRLMAGLEVPTDGSIVVAGKPVKGPRQDVGFMFQRPTLLPWRTALENVTLPRKMGKRREPGREKALDLLQLVGLAGFEHAYPTHLSGGMQQRVALARLLHLGVDILLLDEPFGAVDEFTRERLNLELLKIHAATGSTIVLVTHNILEAVLLADRVVALSPHPGRVAEIIDVPIPRPRSLDVLDSPHFTATVSRVRHVFTGQGDA